MDKQDIKTNFANLEKSLRDKGAVKGSKAIPHEEMLEDTGLLFSLTSLERGYLFYLRHKQEIGEAYLKSNNWGVVFSTVVYCDEHSSQEAFIDYVEDVYKTNVKDAKHLQELTGITNLYNYWDKDRGFLTDEEAEKLSKENNKPLESYEATPGQTGAEAIRELEDTIQGSKLSKYTRDLDNAIQEGAKYKDLLQIKPKDYGLPETWDYSLYKDQYNAILWAIGLGMSINEPARLMSFPSLRLIAEELEAPYSVIMDVYKTFNGVVKVKVDYKGLKEATKNRIATFEEKLKKALITYIEKQPKGWKVDRLLVEGKNWGKDRVEAQLESYMSWFILAFKLTVNNEIYPDGYKGTAKQAETAKEMSKAWIDEFYNDFREYLEEAKIVYSIPKFIIK